MSSNEFDLDQAFIVLTGKAANALVAAQNEPSQRTHQYLQEMAKVDAFGQVATDVLKMTGTPTGFLMSLQDAIRQYPKPYQHTGLARWELWREQVAKHMLSYLNR